MYNFIHVFIFLLILIITAPFSYGIRAALDVRYEVFHNGKAETIDCDFCSHYFEHTNIGVMLLSVHSDKGFVEIYFQKFDAENRSGLEKELYSKEVKHSEQKTFEIDFFQRTRVLEGQTVLLKGTDIKFRLIDAYGPGCPKGAIC
ncbi:MAG: hypothetical protein KAQ85_04585 [Thermodesulfovibrionia bacterium]|nr:hypothetical protein [Thermodesulfovibrionia bacterium]MCK5427013.1 hypothetical protein [Thermodesulfovibrionia bacterium]